jgi:hypothetical protein
MANNLNGIAQIIKDQPGVVVVQLGTDVEKADKKASKEPILVEYFDTSFTVTKYQQKQPPWTKCSSPGGCQRNAAFTVRNGKDRFSGHPGGEDLLCDTHIGDLLNAGMIANNIRSFTLGKH